MNNFFKDVKQAIDKFYKTYRSMINGFLETRTEITVDLNSFLVTYEKKLSNKSLFTYSLHFYSNGTYKIFVSKQFNDFIELLSNEKPSKEFDKHIEILSAMKVNLENCNNFSSIVPYLIDNVKTL